MPKHVVKPAYIKVFCNAELSLLVSNIKPMMCFSRYGVRMPQKLFVLGLPGSGKSTVANYITNYCKSHKEQSVTRFGDYKILYQMFKDDQVQKYFNPTNYGGFYVKAPLVYDKALALLEREIENKNYDEYELIVIEFARSDYIRAFDNFSRSFLHDSFFLFLNVDRETGIKRVKNRMIHPSPRSTDDHFVSYSTFDYYRNKDNAKYLSLVTRHLTRKYRIKPQRITVLNNKGPQEDFEKPVSSFIGMIISRSPSFT